MIILTLLIIGGGCLFAAGYHWPRGGKVPNPCPQRFADAEYYLVHIRNEAHLFTEEQVAVARTRAVRLGAE